MFFYTIYDIDFFNNSIIIKAVKNNVYKYSKVMGMNTRGKSKKKIKENDNPFLNLNANAKENDELAKASIKTIANSVVITESDNKRIDRSLQG